MGVLDDTLAQIDTAFAGAPRPPDEELLHEQSVDDIGIASLYDVADWREAPDKTIAYEYAALCLLSPAGYRHFLPAYMSYALRHPGCAIIDELIWSLGANQYRDETLEQYRPSKWALIDDRQRAAIIACLEALREINPECDAAEIDRALSCWRVPDPSPADAEGGERALKGS